MRYLVLLVTLFLLPTLASSQSGTFAVRTTFGKELTDTKHYEDAVDTVGTIGANTYFLVRRRSAALRRDVLLLREVSTDLSQSRMMELPLEYKGYEQDYVAITHYDGAIHLFTSFYNRRTDTDYLLVTPIDVAGLQPDGEPWVLLDLPAYKKNNDERFSIQQPNVNGKYLVSYLTPYGTEKDNFELHVDVLDAELALDFVYVHPTPTTAEKLEVTVWGINRHDEIYLTSRESPEDTRRVDVVQYDRFVHRISARGSQHQRQAILVGDYRVWWPTLTLASDGEGAYLHGVYSEQQDNDPVGVYVQRVGRGDLELIFRMQQPLTKSEQEQYVAATPGQVPDRAASKYLSGYRESTLLPTVGGGGYLHLQTYREEVVSMGSRQVQTLYRNFGDHIVLRFDGAGTVEWVRSIPYYGEHPEAGFIYTGGTLATLLGDDLLLVYNDTERALGKLSGKPEKFVAAHNNVVVRCLLIGPDNTVQEARASHFKETDTLFRVRTAAVDPDTGALIYYVGKNTDRRFARLELN